MSLPDVMERLCAWLISFGCQFTGPDLVKVELSGLPVSLVWDGGELSLVSIERSSPLVIRSSSKLEHVCLCLALAQAASITRGEAQ